MAPDTRDTPDAGISQGPGVSRRGFLGAAAGLSLAGAAGAAGATALAGTAQAAAARRPGERPPNIVLIVLDDLGWGELGSYGQDVIRTPVLDGLAEEGLRFSQAYANPSCSPTRASLMTGLHSGHTGVRTNQDADTALPAGAVTVAEVLRTAGYATAHIGKWGLGTNTADSSAHPVRHGFDYFFGYLTNGQAQDYWPTSLWRNDQRVAFPENATADVTYAPDLFTQEALDFLDRSRDEPFFLNLNYNTPHAPNEIPSDAPYSDEDWPEGERNHAAQITYTDTQIGRLLARLRALGLAENTLVLVTSDNGPHAAGANMGNVGSTLPHDPEFFDSNGGLRGIKFTVYEGGIRVPLIVRLPARLRKGGAPARGSVLREPVAVWDLLPTLAEAAGADAPAGLDGVSFLPALTGRHQSAHPYLYWTDGSGEAVRFGNWKAVRPGSGPAELYDLRADAGESTDLAAAHPALVRKAELLLADAVAEV